MASRVGVTPDAPAAALDALLAAAVRGDRHPEPAAVVVSAPLVAADPDPAAVARLLARRADAAEPEPGPIDDAVTRLVARRAATVADDAPAPRGGEDVARLLARRADHEPTAEPPEPVVTGDPDGEHVARLAARRAAHLEPPGPAPDAGVARLIARRAGSDTVEE